MRNPIACAPCRTAKRQCVHEDKLPCERCRALGRSESCYFPAPGTSSFHRQTKNQRLQKRSDETAGAATPLPQPPAPQPIKPAPTELTIEPGLGPARPDHFSHSRDESGKGPMQIQIEPSSASDLDSSGPAHQSQRYMEFTESAGTTHETSKPASPVGKIDSKHSTAASNSSTEDEGSVIALLSQTDPYQYYTDELINSFLRCSYKWSFFHIPTLLGQIRSRTVDPPILWAILALSSRFSGSAPAPFASQIAASNAFAIYARSLIQPRLETPTLDIVKALLMITGHSWGSGDGSKAWMYLGLAVQMTQSLNLTEELPSYQKATMTDKDFIEAETRRRTAWTCFLMDSLLSGGKGRRRILSASDMKIQLPSEDNYYTFGEAVRCETLSGHLPLTSFQRPSFAPPNRASFSAPRTRLVQPMSPLGIVAYSMRIADEWGNVAHWACSSEPSSQPPWHPSSSYHRLMSQVKTWESLLPPRLEFCLSNLQAHTAMGQGQAYVYMHSVHFMCVLFLYRAYIPLLGPGRRDYVGLTPSTISTASQLREASSCDPGSNGYNGAQPTGSTGAHESWVQWQASSRRGLLSVAAKVLDMMEEIRTFGVYFLKGLVPWIGFSIYTAVGVMLYCYNFPSQEDDQEIVRRVKERVVKGCRFLQEMKNQWPMADSQFLTLKRMQAFYRRLQTHGDAHATAISTERSALGEALVDYGAVQTLEPIKSHGSFYRTSNEHPVPAEAPPSRLPSIKRPPSDAEINDYRLRRVRVDGREPDEYDQPGLKDGLALPALSGPLTPGSATSDSFDHAAPAPRPLSVPLQRLSSYGHWPGGPAAAPGGVPPARAGAGLLGLSGMVVVPPAAAPGGSAEPAKLAPPPAGIFSSFFDGSGGQESELELMLGPHADADAAAFGDLQLPIQAEENGPDLDMLIADATQAFWKTFPGEFWFSPEAVGLVDD